MEAETITPPEPRPSGAPRRRPGLIWPLLAVGIIVSGLWLYAHNHHGATPDPSDLQAPTVAVATVDREDLYNEVTIAAEFRPYMEVELNAKVSGYVTNMNVDFGDKVKKGQLLASLEVPELHAELDAAKAAQQRTEAEYTNAHLIYTRLDGVNVEHSNLVAQQDIDTAEAKDRATAAALASAKADVEKYQTLFDYTQITAPFDGVVTMRYADPGALIQAGTSSDTQARPLVRLSDNYRLRLDFPVSVDDVRFIHLGDKVAVRVQSLGNKLFTGEVSRFTSRVNHDTRTMMTELEVPNPNLELVPGMYAAAAFKLEQRLNALSIPIQAVSLGDTDTVYVVNGGHEIEKRTVTLGLETPTRREVTSGLKEGELVIIGGGFSVQSGEKVETKPWHEPVLP
ncbi:MAG: efflux RND transporter periplasmic adaptor subunit [Verrucomicrobiota bacterium]